MTTVIARHRSGEPHRRPADVAVLRPATVADTEAVLAMSARCSRETLDHRFHGSADAGSYFRALLRAGRGQQTLLAWHGPTCVGVATLGVDATGTAALAVLVEDAWQRRGIGTQLTATLLEGVRATGVSTVHADVLGDDRFILEALRRIAPLTVSISRGIWSIDVALGGQPCQPAGDGPRVGAMSHTTGGRGLDQVSESCATS